MSTRSFVRCSVLFVGCQLLWTSGVSANPSISGGTVRDARAFAWTLPGNESSGYDFHLLYNFPAGSTPAGLNSFNGMLYGTDTDQNQAGDAFAATTSGVVTVLHHFTGVPDGAVPQALTVADGRLYGVTEFGGKTDSNNPAGCGTFFAIALSGSETMRSAFDCAVSTFPTGKLARYNGAFYGETFSGGANRYGTFFVAHDDGTKETLFSFPGRPDAEPPLFGLTELDGAFYGISPGEGNSRQEIFAILPTGAETVVHTFPYQKGYFPNNRLTAVNGVLYGTTDGGGTNDYGTAFSLTPSGAFAVLAQFETIGVASLSSPLIAMGGALYGTSGSGGKYKKGLIFKLTYAGVLTVLYSFAGPNGADPEGPLTEIGGSLYGTTQSGGANNGGVLYSITP
jgi:uncharacterized repeat protein (TIGR03803 family)